VRTIPEVFATTVARFGSRTAFTFIDRSFTYREYDVLSNRIARALIRRGLQPGDRVAIHLPNLPQYLVSTLGALKAGCIISGLSPLATDREIDFQLRDLGASALISFDDVYAKNARHLIPALPLLKTVVITRPLDLMPFPVQFFGRLLGKVPHPEIRFSDAREIWFNDFLRPESDRDCLVERLATDTAAIQYTGGTTGRSKGAMLSHANLLANIDQSIAVTRPETGCETGLSILPFFHIAGLTAALNTIVIGGAWLLIPNPRDLDFIIRQLRKYRPSLIFAVPLLYEKLLARDDFRRLGFRGLKYAMSGAAPMSDALKEALESVIKVPVLEGYGMTEASPGISVNYPGRVRPGTVGQALPGTEVKILRLDDEAEVQGGDTGQLVVSGPQVMQGYWNNPAETGTVLRKHDGKIWLKTGDVARIDADGYISIVDRVKDMVNVGGYKVFSAEVENVFLQHPAVEVAAIVGAKDPASATEVVQLIIQPSAAYRHQEQADLRQEILRYAREKLAAYKVPRSVFFVGTLPVTPIGKVNKKVLRAMLSEGQIS
jgi:long-chain acyl-CoA synthetase